MITLTRRDITRIPADVIVNSANPCLAGIGPDLPPVGGGVDGAIHRAAGIDLYNACQSLPSFKGYYEGQYLDLRCNHGDLRVTRGFALPCRYVIHAVAPVYADGASGELALLRSLYETIFSTLTRLGLTSIALPPLGTRSYGMPKGESAEIAVRVANSFAERHSLCVTFSVIDDNEYRLYRHHIKALQGGRG